MTTATETNTHLQGSLIAAGGIDEHGVFQDKKVNGEAREAALGHKNLNLSTKTLTFENSTNTNYSSNSSMSVGVNGNSEKVTSASTSFSTGLNLERSKTLATLGQGNITIKDKENSDDLERLNTDTTQVDKSLFKTNTGTSVDARLDTRLLTKEGREEIKQQFNDMDENMNAIAKTLPNAKSDNPVEAVTGTVWDTLATVSGGILPTEANHGGLLANVSVIAGDDDSNFKVTGDSDSTLAYLNGQSNTLLDAIQGGNNLIGDLPHQNWYNPTHGIIGDTLESATDLLLNQFGIQTGISKKVETLQNNGIAWDIYLHSQGNLIAKAGANTNTNTYHSYGSPLPSATVEKIFGINKDDIEKNKGDFVANPLNIFWIPNWFEPGHGTENYGAAKKSKEQLLNKKEE